MLCLENSVEGGEWNFLKDPFAYTAAIEGHRVGCLSKTVTVNIQNLFFQNNSKYKETNSVI